MKKGRKLSLWGIGIVVLPVFVIFGLHLKLKHDVDSYKKKLLAKGEKLTITELMPSPSTNGNAAQVFQRSAKVFSSRQRDNHPSMMRMVAPGRAQASWKSDEIYDRDSKTRTNIWKLISKDFDDNPENFEELRNAADNGELVFPVAYEQGFRALLPHLVPIKNAAIWLSTAAIYELHEGNKTAAAENLNAALRFLENYKPEPLLISHLVRIACLNITFNATWEVLQNSTWTDAELKGFQDGWAAIPFDDLEKVFSMERAMGIQTFAEARETGEDPSAMTMAGSSSTFFDDVNEFTDKVFVEPEAAFKALLNQPNRKLWKWIKSYRDEMEILKLWQAGIEASRKIKSGEKFLSVSKELEKTINQQSGGDEDFIFEDSKTIVVKIFSKFLSAKIAKQLAVTACGLERYKVENHSYPERLKQLIPKFLTTVPLDPIDGQPLRYRANSDGTFLLYSVGENGIDDQGDARLSRDSKTPPANPEAEGSWAIAANPTRALDWVWPISATAEQISEWERHESGGKVK